MPVPLNQRKPLPGRPRGPVTPQSLLADGESPCCALTDPGLCLCRPSTCMSTTCHLQRGQGGSRRSAKREGGEREGELSLHSTQWRRGDPSKQERRGTEMGEWKGDSAHLYTVQASPQTPPGTLGSPDRAGAHRWYCPCLSHLLTSGPALSCWARGRKACAASSWHRGARSCQKPQECTWHQSGCPPGACRGQLPG